MAQLTAQIVSYDDEFKRQIAHLLRACGVPVGIVEGAAAPRARRRTSWSSTSAPTPRRAWRRSSGCAPARREPGHLRHRGRAGAGADPPGDARRRERVLPLERRGRPTAAARRPRSRSTARCGGRAARREAATPAPSRRASRMRFLGAKGGAGTTTVAVNCARRSWRG